MHILLIDDHYMAVEFYTTFVKEYFSCDTSLTITTAYDCEQAYKIITKENNATKFDLAFVDYRLPAYPVQNLYSGSEIVELLRQKHNSCKIVMITGHTEALTIYDIIWRAHPDGLAAKNDITYEVLKALVSTVEGGGYFKSTSVQKSAQKILNEKVLTDSVNRRIISLIYKGYKVKDLHTLIKLRPSSIHRRILNLKKALCIPDNKNIVRELIDRGYMDNFLLG